MMPILTSADYPEIRETIDISLDAATLPDTTIARDGFIGEAMREVISLDPDAESRTGDEAARVRLAAIYLTAARLLPALRQPTMEQVLDSRYQWEKSDASYRVAQLRAEATAMLSGTYGGADATISIDSLVYAGNPYDYSSLDAAAEGAGL